MEPVRNLVAGSTRVDLRALQEGTYPLILEESAASLEIDPASSLALTEFRFEGELVWLHEDRRVRGLLSGTLSSVCDRCLGKFTREIGAEVEARIRILTTASAPPSSVDRGTPEESPEEFVAIEPDQTELDLAETFRSAVLLEVPIKNVCREDCRGLCPVCGTNRNETSCTCVTESTDPRWDALKGLRFDPHREE
ncbi:MAG: DUF177 domain-containing protein [Gemmatimonadetes bacterium]|nr:DUF177 domain-containing protein [Gemmatimonadota bacterium]